VFVSQPFAALPSQLPKPELHDPSWQTPPEQVAPAFAKAHTLPHAPQLLTSVFRFASQPFDELPSQLPRPAEHDVMPHTPPVQLAVPPVEGHTLPHVLQLLTFVFRFVSQPFDPMPSQLPNPVLHEGTQFPELHAVVPFWVWHWALQAPQFDVVLRLVSQPFFGSPSQLWKPELHTGVHVPVTQLVVPCAFEHPMAQPPQLLPSVWVFVSQPSVGSPLQSAKPAAHVGVHVPAGHAMVPWALLHAAPQAPQFRVVLSDASQPVLTKPSQLPNPALQATEQAPRAQLAVPFVPLQAEPHVPQFSALVCVFTSQPFEAMPSQLPNPALHVPSVHVPEAHEALAFAGAHGAPQAPQSVSVVRLFSQPFAALPSQFANRGLHAPIWHVPLKHVAAAFA
jgi:hypothetical protein